MPEQPIPPPPRHADEVEDHDRGLGHDLGRLLGRRSALALLGGAGLVAVATACGAGGGSDAGTASTASTTASTNGSTGTTESSSDASACSEIPEETNGPFPADGSNGPDILSTSGIVRSDITGSFGDASGVAAGVPLTIALTVVDTANGCRAYEGAAIYAWHCDREGRYSMYSQGAEAENYLRGVQVADADGIVRFTSIFPAAYSGRWPHVHFEAYPTLDDATSAGNRLRTSQLALPEDTCNEVYATDGYEQSVANMQRTSLESDMVFGDGWSLQMGKIAGAVGDKDLTVALTVPV